MSILSFCRYLSLPPGEAWRDEDYGAWMFVRAAKEEPFNGYSYPTSMAIEKFSL